MRGDPRGTRHDAEVEAIDQAARLSHLAGECRGAKRGCDYCLAEQAEIIADDAQGG